MQKGRPDLVVLVGGQPRLVIESKFGAGFTGGHVVEATSDDQQVVDSGDGEAAQVQSQIPRYIGEIRESGWPARVLLISLWPRVLAGLETEPLYLGNMLWSDVYTALRQSNAGTEERARVLRLELLALMEDLGMTETQPLRLGDGQAFWNYQKVMDRMAALMERMREALSAEFDVEILMGKPGKTYCYCFAGVGNIIIDFGLIAGVANEPNCPIWPIIHVRPHPTPNADAKAHAVDKENAHRALACETDSPGPAWPGQCAYSTTAELSRFLGAWDWEEQASQLLSIQRGWFQKLAAAGLLRHK